MILAMPVRTIPADTIWECGFSQFSVSWECFLLSCCTKEKPDLKVTGWKPSPRPRLRRDRPQTGAFQWLLESCDFDARKFSVGSPGRHAIATPVHESVALRLSSIILVVLYGNPIQDSRRNFNRSIGRTQR